MPFAAERAWAVALAQNIANDIPNAVANVPGLVLNSDQIARLQVTFQARLLRTMGEDADETPNQAFARSEQPE
jgi:hypothetical protein